MASELYAFDDDDARGSGRDHLFLWTVFILLLIGIAFACWLGSFYVFGHPEQPRSYAILRKLKKIEPPKRFEVTQAPPGEFLSPQKLFARYSGMERLQLEAENAELLRNYIKNYKESKKLVPYITGKFEIIQTYELKSTDLFSTGVVSVAAADEYSQVIIEHVFTTAPGSVEAMKANLPPGLDMRLEKSRDLAAVIHIDRTDDGRLLFTAVPLLYGAWGVKGSIGSFSLEPPSELNLKAGAPIVRGQPFAEAMVAYASSRRGKPVASATADGEVPPSGPVEPELVRVDTVAPGTPMPETGAIPALTVATPIPVATPKGGHMVVAANTRGTPSPGPTAVATPIPTSSPRLAATLPTQPGVESSSPPVMMTRSGVPLKPFIVSQPVPGASTDGGTWRTYTRGQQPPGRSVSPAEAGTMANDGGEIVEHLYLRGDFVVRASGGNRAVLRAPAAPGQGGGEGTGPERIIVEYPPSALPPQEGSTLSRDDSTGFEVRSVRRSQDGQINIYVREITRG